MAPKREAPGGARPNQQRASAVKAKAMPRPADIPPPPPPPATAPARSAAFEKTRASRGDAPSATSRAATPTFSEVSSIASGSTSRPNLADFPELPQPSPVAEEEGEWKDVVGKGARDRAASRPKTQNPSTSMHDKKPKPKAMPVVLTPSSKAKASSSTDLPDRPTMPKARAKGPKMPRTLKSPSKPSNWLKGAWFSLTMFLQGMIGTNEDSRRRIFSKATLVSAMKTLPHLLRHEHTRPEDTAMSLHEVFEYGYGSKLRDIANTRDDEIIPRIHLSMLTNQEYRKMVDPINFVMPLILGLFLNPKDRYNIAFLDFDDTRQDPSLRLKPEDYINVGQRLDFHARQLMSQKVSNIEYGLISLSAAGGESKRSDAHGAPLTKQ